LDSEEIEIFAAIPRIAILSVTVKIEALVMVLLTSMCSILQITKKLSFQLTLRLGKKLLLMAILTKHYGV